MDKTIILSMALNMASLTFLYFTYKKYKEATECLRSAEQAEEEAYKNLHSSWLHLKKCKELTAKLETKGAK